MSDPVSSVPRGSPPRPHAFVLAGGRSQRMGRNKALLPAGDTTLIERVIRVASAVASRVDLVANDAQTYAHLGLEVHADRWPGKGPLNGIGTALSHSTTEHAIVLACDLPFVTPAFLETLLRSAAGADVVIPETAGQGLHPLAAVYSRRCLAPIERSLAAGRLRVVSFFDEVRVVRLGQEALAAAGHGVEILSNVNTPEEHREALERLRGDDGTFSR